MTRRVNRYDVVSRYLWLWVSGMMASNAAWSFLTESYKATVFFAGFALVLLLLFLGTKPRVVEIPTSAKEAK